MLSKLIHRSRISISHENTYRIMTDLLDFFKYAIAVEVSGVYAAFALISFLG